MSRQYSWLALVLEHDPRRQEEDAEYPAYRFTRGKKFSKPEEYAEEDEEE